MCVIFFFLFFLGVLSVRESCCTHFSFPPPPFRRCSCGTDHRHRAEGTAGVSHGGEGPRVHSVEERRNESPGTREDRGSEASASNFQPPTGRLRNVSMFRKERGLSAGRSSRILGT